MSLSQKTELARALFRTPPNESVTRISGTATADSSDGTVTVELEDGDVIEVGTIGSVSQGQTVTIHVQRGEAQVIAAEGWGDAMQTAVDEAQAIAEATNQHFWSDTNGAHVTQVTQEEWETTPTGPNALWNSLGMLLRNALTNLAAFTTGNVSFYDGNGNAAANVTANFGNSGAQIGKAGESHLEMDYHSLRMIDKEGHEFFGVEDLRDSTGVTEVIEEFIGDGTTTSFPLGAAATDTNYTVTVSDSSGGTVTKNLMFFAFSTAPTAGAKITVAYESGDWDIKAYTFGTRSAGQPVGIMSHAEGFEVIASGYHSHAEGSETKASGWDSHAEGASTEASGHRSHAQGYGTVAKGQNQTVIGRHNVADTTSALIVGNGGSGARSNALTVDWSGNVAAAGDVRAGGSTPLVPIGTILDYAAATAPSGYLVCDGSAVSRTTYAALFAVIGTTWGAGNGSTTFNVPDFRGRTSIGAGTGTGGNATAHALGSKGGDEALASHSHQASAGGDYKFQAIKNASGVAGSFNLQAHSSGNDRYALASTNSANLTYYTSTQSTGAGNGGNMPPYATVTKIIRAI
jgi:microcystin-dependent protein